MDKKEKNFYITTTLPYVNADPHVGHATEFVRADVIARWKAFLGYEVFFNTGTDEHGSKVWNKAKEDNVSIDEYTLKYSNRFKELLPRLGIGEEKNITRNFIRTTDESHIKSAQEFWRACIDRKAPNGETCIYKKNYKVKYCVGCELQKTDSELVNGKCSIHQNLIIENIDEENYFFRLSAFGEVLLDFYKKNPNFIVPDFRLNEITSFVKNGLEDFSISRLKSKMPWGVPVPGDSEHVMYVWFDALVNYISAIGWPYDMHKFDEWWVRTGGVVQYCGKDNIRQQSLMWQAMLVASGFFDKGYPLSKQIIINGFLTGEGGVKMSKSLGNVIDPIKVLDEYGTDAFRYFVTRELNSFEDSPFTHQSFKNAYNTALANGLGNLVSRVLRMAINYEVDFDLDKDNSYDLVKNIPEFAKIMDTYNLKNAMDYIWSYIQNADKEINLKEPFKLYKTNPDEAKNIVRGLLDNLNSICIMLKPFMPETSKKIEGYIFVGLKSKIMPAPLFLRKE